MTKNRSVLQGKELKSEGTELQSKQQRNLLTLQIMHQKPCREVTLFSFPLWVFLFVCLPFFVLFCAFFCFEGESSIYISEQCSMLVATFHYLKLIFIPFTYFPYYDSGGCLNMQ